ncbi:Uncharacterised protein [Salmonella enterica subsp. enterica]|uniref:Uncharacterized protein n=1 Tax=Salmonella enterica I TaxID=59201 RepID=A0A447P9G6_SALET|nr:Uncharacterised protein [Salmonella enterica subsp. enterica]
MPVYRRAIMNFDLIIRPATRQLHMLVAGRNVGMTWQYAFAVLGLLHADLTEFIQTLGKRAGKARRHMLRNNHCRTGKRQRLQHMSDSFSTAR